MRMTSARQFAFRLHADQRGSMSIVSVFSIILLAALLGMVINVGRHADRKVKMQNTADNATYSGGVALARSMNALAFTNHLLCDVFAMTAYLREARDRNAEVLAGPVLDAWQAVGPVFASAPFPKFAAMGSAIPEKVRLERELVRTFSEYSAAVSEQLLPVMENILDQEMIPEFQRALVQTAPHLAQRAVAEVARRDGLDGIKLGNGAHMEGFLWRTDATVVGGNAEWARPTLPVIDPTDGMHGPDSPYFKTAERQREVLSHHYLDRLNRVALQDFDRIGKMSQFANLWRGFTCAQLEHLLEIEYPNRDLLFVLREDELEALNSNLYLERDYMFVGVTYWEQMPERLPGLFHYPIVADDATFAQIYLFLPRPRLVKRNVPYLSVRRENVPTNWDLLNQNWTVQLVPATSRGVPRILQTAPPGGSIAAHDLGDISVGEFRRINTH